MEKKEIATLNSVVIEKDKLLEVLKDNREKHEAIYLAAVSGYWVKSQQALNERKKDFKNSIKEVKDSFGLAVKNAQQKIQSKEKNISFSFASSVSVRNGWDLKYPENHLSDYDTTIRKVELSCIDKIQLDSTEFDSYVMNNWGWKGQFINSNNLYINAVTGCFNLNAISGMAATSSNKYLNQTLLSGTSWY
jgi:hypothetical protein